MSRWTAGVCLALAITGTLLAADPQNTSKTGDGFVIVRPEEIRWQPAADIPGLQTAVISGDPSKPGLYVLRVKFPPGVMTRPHIHNQDRLVSVLQGTWWVGTGPDFNPDKTTPLKAGSFMKHPAGAEHYDGAKDEEAVVQIIGMGPASTNFLKPELGATGSSRTGGKS